MRDVIILIAVTAVFAFGFYLMGGLDNFLDSNRRKIKKDTDYIDDSDKEPPSCVMLTGDLSQEEIAMEVKSFLESHDNPRIMLYEESSALFSEKDNNKNHS